MQLIAILKKIPLLALCWFALAVLAGPTAFAAPDVQGGTALAIDHPGQADDDPDAVPHPYRLLGDTMLELGSLPSGPGGLLDLTPLLDPGALGANVIDEAEQAAVSVCEGGNCMSARFDPRAQVPEPGPQAMLCAGMAVLGAGALRRRRSRSRRVGSRAHAGTRDA